MNLSEVYYEVWNEPDLFGKWKYFGSKNYLTLYQYASLGAQNTQNTNTFYLGGPATTQLYKNWVIALAKHTQENKLRLDFFSWHRYHIKPEQYASDVADITQWLFFTPEYISIPRVISEWGFNSDIDAGYDQNLSAAHSIAAIRHSLYGYQQLFAFELVDGPDPQNQIFWGRWGLLTHPKFGERIKPRYLAFDLINQLKGKRLVLKGEGTWVKGIAAQEDKIIRVILSNYDIHNQHMEVVPVTFVNLKNPVYQLKQTKLAYPATISQMQPNNEQLVVEVIMLPNSVILLELIP